MFPGSRLHRNDRAVFLSCKSMGEGRGWGLLGGAIQDIEEVGVGLGVVRRGAKKASALLVRMAVLPVLTAFFKWREG